MGGRVIITGANGFIGSKTTECFLQHGWEVLALDCVITPSRLIPHPNLTYVCWDMQKGGVEDLLLEEFLPEITGQTYDVFVHFAWSDASGPMRKNLAVQMKNVYATARCVELAKQFGCTKFVGAGSLMEYEVAEAAHYARELTSANNYGMAKLNAHYLAKQTAQELDIDFVWAIITNIYGVGEKSPRFINNILRDVLGGQPIKLNTTGEQLYDFVYIDDGARAFYDLACLGRDNVEYVIGSGDARPLREWVWDICEVFKLKDEPQFGEQLVDCCLPFHDFSIAAITKHTGWKPEVTFKRGILRTRKWLQHESTSNFLV